MYRKDAAFLEKKLQKLQKQGKIEEMYEVSKILYDNSNEPHSVARHFTIKHIISFLLVNMKSAYLIVQELKKFV